MATHLALGAVLEGWMHLRMHPERGKNGLAKLKHQSFQFCFQSDFEAWSKNHISSYRTPNDLGPVPKVHKCICTTLLGVVFLIIQS